MNKRFHIHDLEIFNLRRFSNLKRTAFTDLNIVEGYNGAGKSTLLEGISLLIPGSGLKNQKLGLLSTIDSGGKWAVNAKVSDGVAINLLGVELRETRKILKINGKAAKKFSDFGSSLELITVTQEENFLLLDSATTRRNFFDRLFCRDLAYGESLRKYRHFLSERNRILQIEPQDTDWLDLIENNLANLNIKIALKRKKIFEELSHYNPQILFSTKIISSGGLEDMVLAYPDNPFPTLLEKFRNSRYLDARLKKTTLGIHLSKVDILHFHDSRNITSFSSGEQRLMLMSVVLNYIHYLKINENVLPVLVLDDILEFLDEKNSIFLVNSLLEHGNQIFLSRIIGENSGFLKEANIVHLK